MNKVLSLQNNPAIGKPIKTIDVLPIAKLRHAFLLVSCDSVAFPIRVREPRLIWIFPQSS